ncbi:MAG: RICIN domain-containing protein [Dermatophilaceae bacterium]
MSTPTSRLLVPMALDVLVLRDESTGLLVDGDFRQSREAAPVTGPSATGPSAAAGWELFNGTAADATSTSQQVPTTGAQPAQLNVTTTAAGSGLRQTFGPAGFGPDLTVTTVKVHVQRGQIGIGTGDGDHTRVDARINAATGYRQVRILNASRPANRVALTALSSDGADFSVTHVTVQAVESGQLLLNPGFDAPAAPGVTGPTSLTGADVEGTAAANAWTVRHHGAPATAVTTTARAATTRPGATGSMLAVSSSAAGTSLVQRFLAAGTGPAGVEAGVWIRVTRGTIALGCGPAGESTPGPDAKAGDWTYLRATSSPAPANEIVLAVTSAGGADYTVDAATVTPTDGGQLLANPIFDNPGLGPTRLEQAPLAGPSAAQGWTTWNNVPSVTMTELRASDRRPDGGRMLHVSTTAPGCGIVQRFLTEGTGPGRVIAEAWVRVTRGAVGLGTGDGGNTGIDATSRTTGKWELLTAGNGVSPAGEFIIYATSPGGAEYDVDTTRIRGDQSVTPWADCQMTPPDPAGPALQQLLPAPFATRAPRTPGAYLHWALPDALTHTEQVTAADGSTPPPLFPAIPQRWLVTRLAADEGGKRAVRAWVLDTTASPTAAVVTALENWTAPPEGPVPDDPLTALGHGDPGWAAFYDNVENTLGFFDPLQDAQGPIAYLVCGWYAHSGLDPLAAAAPATASALLDLLASWRWDLPAEEVPMAPLPAALLVHGAAVGIAWPEQTWPGDANGALSREEDQRPNPAAVRLAFAETIPQALTALATSPEEPAQTRTVIEAFLAQASTEDTGPDGPQQLAAALHATRFSASSPDASQETIWQAADPHPMNSPSLRSNIAALRPGDVTTEQSATDGQFTGVARSAPRRYSPGEPTVVLQGAGRSFKHGGDGRFQPDQKLRCRLPGSTVTTLGPAADGSGGKSGDALLGGVQHDGVPPECQQLLAELAALDPGSVAPPQGGTPSSIAAAAVAPALARTRWWASWDPANGDVSLDADGDLPSPLALTPPSRPWNPLRLDWEVRYGPSPGGVRDWALADNDLTPHQLPAALAGTPIRSQTLLTPGPATVVQGAAAAAGRAADGTAAPVGDVAYADLLGCSLDGSLAAIRGDEPGQRVGDGPAPVNPDPTEVRAGVLSLHRLRVVDTYGQVIELLDDTDGHGVDPAKVLIPPELAAPGQPAAVVLPPRFTSPTRVLLRYTSGTGATDPTGGAVEADDAISPVCGYLMADHVGGSIEVFDVAGAAQGRLRPDPVTGTAWDAPPGVDGGYGERPDRRLANTTLAALAANLLDADTAAAGSGDGPNALALTLRLIDAMRSTIDLTATAGDEHLALILGHPIAVMRAELELEVTDAGSPTTPVEVRLGALDRLSDGLLGYYVDNDHSRLHLVEPTLAEAAGLLDDMEPNPYFDPSPLVVAPGHRVALTLLMQPDCDVHVTTGMLPQKAVGMRRGWVSGALAKLTPSLRYGPVLVPAGQIRLPLPTDVSGTWTWVRRDQPGSWALDEATPGVGDTALPDRPAHLAEGWLRLALTDASWEQFGIPVPVTSISKPRRDRAGQPLLGVGGTNAAGRPWLLRSDQVIDLVRSGRYVFSMQPTVDGNPAGLPLGNPLPLLVTAGPDGVDTLTTGTAQDPVDRLPTLPESEVGIRIWDPANPATTQPDDFYRRYFLTARHSGLALDVYGPTVAKDGAAVQQFGLHGGANQQWQFAWTDSSYFRITAWVSGKCLEVAQGSSAEGAAVDQADYSGAKSQQWQAVSTRDGYVVLYARHSGKCLTVSGGPGATGNEARCVQADYLGLPNQQWKLGDVPLAPSLDATVLNLTLPTTMWTWQGDRVRATVRNTGNTTWTPEAGHSLLPVGGLRGLRVPSQARTQFAVSAPVLPGQSVSFDALLAGSSEPAQLTGSMAMQIPGDWPYSEQSPPAPQLFGRVGEPVSVTVVPVTPAQLSATDATILPDGPRSLTLLAGWRRGLEVGAMNSGGITWYPQLDFGVVLAPGTPPQITAFNGWIDGPVPPGSRAGGLLETTGGNAGVYPVFVHVVQRRDGVDVEVSPPGPPVNITVCGLQSVKRPDGTDLPTTLRRNATVTMHVNLNVPAPREDLSVYVIRDSALLATLRVPQDATYVEHVIDSEALTLGVHYYEVDIGDDRWRGQIIILDKGKDGGKDGGKDTKEHKDKDGLAKEKEDLTVERTATPGAGDPGSSGTATPWISGEERPDVGEQLYRDSEQ